MVVKKEVVKNKKEMEKILKGIGRDVYCIAKDSVGKIITPYFVDIELSDMDSFISEDLVGEVRIYKDKSLVNEKLCTPIDGYLAEVDVFPVFCDWVEYPITDVYLCDDENIELLLQYKKIGLWRYIE